MVDLNLEKEFENFEPPKRTPAQKKAAKENFEKRQQKEQRDEFERLYKKYGSILNKMYSATHGKKGRLPSDAGSRKEQGKFFEDFYTNKNPVPGLSPAAGLSTLRAIDAEKRNNPNISYMELKEKVKGPAPKLKAKYGGKVSRGRAAQGSAEKNG